MSQLPLTDQDKDDMLAGIGVREVGELFAPIPEPLRRQAKLDLPPALTEMELLSHLGELADGNFSTAELTCFLGAGVYDHFIPSIVLDVVSRPEFKTAYTPYQAEMQQGILQAIYEYQTMICELTGLEAANASVYDGATALAEGVLMALSHTRRTRAVIARSVHPAYRATVRSHTSAMGVAVDEIGFEEVSGALDLGELDTQLADDVACVALQSPNYLGVIEDVAAVAEAAHAAGALCVVSADPISLGILKPPGACGADICTGEGQPLGLPMSFGGPLLGLMSCREQLVRRMPGRIVGATQDEQGRRGYCITLQAREQHIRREKATSNICTNEALCALAAGAYLAAMGPEGLRDVAALCTRKAHYARTQVCQIHGVEPAFDGPFVKEFAVRVPVPAGELAERLCRERGILAGLPLAPDYPETGEALLIAVTEKRTRGEIDALAEAVQACL